MGGEGEMITSDIMQISAPCLFSQQMIIRC